MTSPLMTLTSMGISATLLASPWVTTVSPSLTITRWTISVFPLCYTTTSPTA